MSEQKVQISKYGAAFHCPLLSFLFVFAFTIKVTGVILVTMLSEAIILCYFSLYHLFVLVHIQLEHLKQRLFWHLAKTEQNCTGV